jgi:hypothetical protein
MQRQGSFSQAGYAGKKKQTRRDKFLAEIRRRQSPQPQWTRLSTFRSRTKHREGNFNMGVLTPDSLYRSWARHAPYTAAKIPRPDLIQTGLSMQPQMIKIRYFERLHSATVLEPAGGTHDSSGQFRTGSVSRMVNRRGRGLSAPFAMVASITEGWGPP